MELKGKIFIRGEIHTLTGLHIGGAKSALDIGGVDLSVVKKPGGVPYIPGSSLKGKLRSLLARAAGTTCITAREAKNNHKSDEKDAQHIAEIFGLPGNEPGETAEEGTPRTTRLIVRDADLDEEKFKERFGEELELGFSEVKWENSINRTTGTAQHPRQLERVPAGAVFKFEMVYDKYDDDKYKSHLEYIIQAMRLLQSDYLGGHGSRGYGKIAFENVEFFERDVEDFKDKEKEPKRMEGFVF